MPSASAMQAMVLAVPITAQVPAVVARLPSISSISLRVDHRRAVLGPEAPAVGARTQPLAAPGHRQHRAGDELDRGQSAETAPISCAGTVLSQPPISTHASMGCARIISSTSIDMRLRNMRLVGLRKISPSEMVGKSSGKPPAEHAALDRFHQFRHVAVAIVEPARGLRDADDGPVQHLQRIAHRAREGTAQVEREVAVAVVGEVAAQAVGLVVGHRPANSTAKPHDAGCKARTFFTTEGAENTEKNTTEFPREQSE